MSSTITINGKTYQGSSVSITNGRVVIDGKEMTDAKLPEHTTHIKVTGDLASLTTDLSVTAQNVQGDVYAGGSVSCDDVGGDISAKGSVSCDDVEGSVSAGGSVNCDDIGGSVTAGGSVNRG